MNDFPELRDIVEKFGFHATGFQEARGGFNKNWIVSCSDKKFVLKRRPTSALQRSKTECELSEFLASRGFPTAKPVKSPSGNFILQGNSYVFSLFEFVNAGKYVDSVPGLKAAARSMALFHEKTVGYAGTQSFQGTSLNWCERSLEEYSGPGKEKFAEMARENMLEIEQRSEELSRALVHWDFHAGNLLAGSDKVFVFDLEFAHEDYRVMDVANSLSLLAALSPGKIDYGDALSFVQECELDFNKARAFLSEYNSCSALNENDFKSLPAALSLAWISWSLYTFNKLSFSEKLVEKALYFPAWVEKNRDKILKRLFV